MRAWTLAGVVGGLLFATCGSASASTACPGDEQSATAAALVCDLNTVRAQHGLQPLRPDARLAAAAQDLATDMAAHHFLSHISSDGRTPLERLTASGYMGLGALVLENLDWGSDVFSSPLATTYAWMNSDTHRAHLLDPAVRDVGVGIARGSMTAAGVQGAFYVADFGRRERTRCSKRRLRGVHHRRCRA